jgi:plastocyanin
MIKVLSMKSALWRRAAAGIALGALLAAPALAGNLQVKVIDKEGNPVVDAVVVVIPAGGGQPKTPLPMQAVITQEKMRFLPAVSLVGVGAKAQFVNNDPWEHHVRASAAGVLQFSSGPGEGFELRLDGKPEGKPAKTADATFDKAGPVLLGCHLHASMRGHVYVSDSPWAVLTNAEGVASFEAVSNGGAFVKVWHADQLIDIAPKQLTLTPAPANASMQLSVVPRRRRI